MRIPTPQRFSHTAGHRGGLLGARGVQCPPCLPRVTANALLAVAEHSDSAFVVRGLSPIGRRGPDRTGHLGTAAFPAGGERRARVYRSPFAHKPEARREQSRLHPSGPHSSSSAGFSHRKWVFDPSCPSQKIASRHAYQRTVASSYAVPAMPCQVRNPEGCDVPSCLHPVSAILAHSASQCAATH